MNKKIAISVISIGRNCLRDVDVTFQSVVSQKFEIFEYIIIDGNSNDGTREHIKSLSQLDPRITFISESDSGISDAMNKGARLASGKLIIHLHFGDKFIADDVLAKVWTSYLRNSWSWAAGNLLITNNSENVNTLIFKPGNASNLRRKNCVPHQSTFISRELFSEAGGFDVNLKQAMDYDLWLRVHFVKKQELFDLKMDIASFDSAGASSQIFPLIKGNYWVRKKMRAIYCPQVSQLENMIFITRIFVYWLYYKTNISLSTFFR